ncbi:hypothetical protein PAXRUDRAFT_152958, partial [Paxillus rubicundulus Ve08.2h10]
PKPEGESRRPSRGGYNLEAQLAWNATSFSKLRKFVHPSIKQYLDTTKCKYWQRNQAIQLVIQGTCKVFPDLDDCQSCWPVHTLMQLQLKYTLGRTRMSQWINMGDVKEKRAKNNTM